MRRVSLFCASGVGGRYVNDAASAALQASREAAAA